MGVFVFFVCILKMGQFIVFGNKLTIHNNTLRMQEQKLGKWPFSASKNTFQQLPSKLVFLGKIRSEGILHMHCGFLKFILCTKG